MSIQAARSAKPADAVILAESALKAEKELTPAVAASLHGRLALGAARAGDQETWRRAQDRAFDLFARTVPAAEPSWIYWFTEAEVNGIAGQSLLALGRPGEAEPYLRRTLALIDPAFARDRAGWLCHLASSRIATGAVDHACATAKRGGHSDTTAGLTPRPAQAGRFPDCRRPVRPQCCGTRIRRQIPGPARLTDLTPFGLSFGAFHSPSHQTINGSCTAESYAPASA